jgi:TRAP-type uncharacterized transport system fused permease subunit
VIYFNGQPHYAAVALRELLILALFTMIVSFILGMGLTTAA